MMNDWTAVHMTNEWEGERTIKSEQMDNMKETVGWSNC